MDKTIFEKQIYDGFRLTTAEIIYHMPDMPHLLQSYIWQDYDVAPTFPILNQFLLFWKDKIDGPLHSVILAEKRIITADEIHHHGGEYLIH